MINDNTILSSFNDRPTLLEWLKKVEEALKTDTATAFHVNNRGNATLTFSIDFADGSSIESGPIVLQQGESINGADIRNGHLYLSLTNGDELDAGNVKPVNSFLINPSQHLIVKYDDGTNQDLGAIFSGNVNIDGNLTANSIIENMSGYGYAPITKENATITYTYVGVVKNGNKITFACSGFFSRSGNLTGGNCPLIKFTMPDSIGAKLYPSNIDGANGLAFMQLYLAKSYSTGLVKPLMVIKDSDHEISPTLYALSDTEVGTPYLFRFEITFLLSDNLAG